MTTPTQSPAAKLLRSLFVGLLLAGLLGWALFLPARPSFRSSRPPLVTPVSLDWLVEPKPLPTPTAAPPASGGGVAVGSDGLKPW